MPNLYTLRSPPCPHLSALKLFLACYVAVSVPPPLPSCINNSPRQAPPSTAACDSAVAATF